MFRKNIIQFMDVFSNIKIERYAKDGKTIDRHIEVPIKYAMKEKSYLWLNERKDDAMLPMITTYISSIDFATDRKVNAFYNFTSECDLDAGTVQTYLHPTPYNISFNMSIWALYMVDIDQILEQILPYFNPNIFIRIGVPELNAAFDAKVLFRSATPEVSRELDDPEYRVLMYTLDFELQSWLFRPVQDSGLIKNIYGSYFSDPTAFNNYTTDTTSTFSSGASGGITFQLGGDIDDQGNLLVKYNLFDVEG
jgi:hypothetical protein